MTDTYIVKYSCGCEHEIEAKPGIHVPTGNNKNCKLHKGD